MRQRPRAMMLGLTLAVGIAVGAIGARVLDAQQSPVKRTELLRKDLAAIPGQQGIMYVTEFGAGAASGKHHHLGDEFVYVLEGSGTLEAEGQSSRSLKAGDAFHQPPHRVMNVKNDSASASLKVLVFLIAPAGQPLAVPVH